MGGGTPRAVVSEGDIEAGGTGGGAGIYGKSIVGLIQIGQGDAGGGLGDDQGSTGSALIVGVVKAGGHGIGAGLDRGGRRTVIGESHP